MSLPITEAEFVESQRKLDKARDALADALAIFECTEPAGGLGPGTHCAACCYGTGYVVTCEEDDELVRTLSEALSTLRRIDAEVTA